MRQSGQPQNANGYIKPQCFAAPNPSNRLGTSGRNGLIGPGLIEMDFSLFKNIPIPKISGIVQGAFPDRDSMSLIDPTSRLPTTIE